MLKFSTYILFLEMYVIGILGKLAIYIHKNVIKVSFVIASN